MQRSRFLAAVLAAGAAPWVRGGPAPLDFVYPDANGLGTAGFGFHALRLALQKWGRPFELRLVSAPTNIPRSLRALAQGALNVMDLGISAAFERQFQAVYLPIDRGLSGWRLLVVRADAEPRFAAVRSLADLARLRIGQGSDWPDVEVLRAAGLSVATADRLDLLFRLLQAGRFDALPLGLNEVHGFLERYRALAPDAAIEPGLALVYRFARLFFVRRGDAERHAAIAQGLGRAFDDGSFQALFAADPATRAALARARLGQRRVLHLSNDGLSEAARAMPARYFMRP